MTRVRMPRRRGAFVVLMAVGFIVAVAIVALAVDIGYVYTVRAELQRSADSAAIAAAWELLQLQAATPLAPSSDHEELVYQEAVAFARENQVSGSRLELASSDVKIGVLDNPSDPSSSLQPAGSRRANAVQVRVRKTEQQNGGVPLFFARALGINQMNTEATATAAFRHEIGGFRVPRDDEGNLKILPIALHESAWDSLIAGNGTDNFRFDSTSKSVVSGGDGIPEVNIYPQQTGSAGNSGTVDIGSPSNSTAELMRQITQGISPGDVERLERSGRTLQFNPEGKLELNADPGISAGIKDSLSSIHGQTRMIPIFRSVNGGGNNGEYTIVKFVGVRVMHTNLTGGDKQVIVQPAGVVTRSAVQPTGGEITSQYIFTPPWLVR